MIEKISWANYAASLLIIVIIYYVVVALIYYRKEIAVSSNKYQRFFSKKNVGRNDGTGYNQNSFTHTKHADSKDSDRHDYAGDIATDSFRFIEKIRVHMLKYAQEGYIKEEIITGLQLLIKE